MIKIPNLIIRNRQISHNAFYLYVILKTLTTKSIEINMIGQELLDILVWKDARTLSKYLDELKLNQLIKYEGKVTPKKVIKITVLPTSNLEFTLVLKKIINKIRVSAQKTNYIENGKQVVYDFKEVCIRLFYYLEMNYNAELGVSYPTYAHIYRDIGVVDNITSVLTKLMEEIGILTIKEGAWVKIDGRPIKTRNNYVPVMDRKT